MESWKETDNELPSSVSLYSVTALMQPTKLHPKFYDFQHGLLVVLLYAANENDADDRAREIFAQLPWYEPLSSQTIVMQGEETPSIHPQLPRFIEAAKQLGIAVYFSADETGADDEIAIKKFESVRDKQ